MVHMPQEVTGKAWKLSRPYFGPYRILSTTGSNVSLHLVDKPDDSPIFVSLSRVRPCYKEIADSSWSGHTQKRKRKKQKRKANVSLPTTCESYSGPTTRSRSSV